MENIVPDFQKKQSTTVIRSTVNVQYISIKHTNTCTVYTS